jgi:hypothetical protein
MADEPYRGPDAAPAVPNAASPAPGRRRAKTAADEHELRAELDELRRRVQQNDDEIDAIQISAAQARAERRTRWFRDPALLVSFVSLLLAFGTTVLSSMRLDADQRHQARTELTGYIQRLADIPRRQAEIIQQHPGAEANNLLSELNAEQQSIAYQARNLILAIPDQVATVEYMAVGYSLQTSGALSDAEALYTEGLRRAASPSDKVYALRSLAYVRYLVRDYDRGRELYQQARDVYADAPNVAALVQANDNANTELQWANAELAYGFCTLAMTHATAAQEIMTGEPLANLNPLLQQLLTGIAACVPRQSPTPSPT